MLYKPQNLCYNIKAVRGVAQFGRALRSGRRGRKFESCHLDHRKCTQFREFFLLLRVLFYLVENVFRALLGH